jgi:PiT family inorganic phosphate transporter
MITAMWVYALLRRLFTKNNQRLIEILTALCVAWDGYSFGANDVANATGVYLAVIGGTTLTLHALGLGISDVHFLALYGAVLIVLGGVVMGWRVVNTVGYRITRLDPPGGLTEAMCTALAQWLFTTIPYILFGYGMPISTTYASVAATFGVGIVRARSLRRGLNTRTVLLVVLSWILTLPIAAGLGILYYSLLSYIVR